MTGLGFEKCWVSLPILFVSREAGGSNFWDLVLILLPCSSTVRSSECRTTSGWRLVVPTRWDYILASYLRSLIRASYFLIRLCLSLKLLATWPSVPSPAKCLISCSICSESPPESVGFLMKCTPFYKLFFSLTSTSTFFVKWKSIRPSCWNSKRFWVFLFNLCTPPSVN